MENRKKILAGLLKKAQKGDSKALEKLCGELRQILHGYFRNRFPSQDVVEDLSQEVYLRVLKTFPEIREPMGFHSFVLKLAFRVMQSHLRTKYRRREENYFDMTAGDGEYEETLARIGHADYSPANIPDKMDMETALEKLPEKTRRILLLKADNYTYEEIAEEVGLSVSGVKMQIKRNLEKLKVLLFNVTFSLFLATILMKLFWR